MESCPAEFFKTDHESDRSVIYNVEQLKKIFVPGPHPVRGHDVGRHWGAKTELIREPVLETITKIWQGHNYKGADYYFLYQEYSKHFTKTPDGKYKYTYNPELQAAIFKIDTRELMDLKRLVQDIIYWFLSEERYKKLGLVPDLDDCSKLLDDLYQCSKNQEHLEALYIFLKDTVKNLNQTTGQEKTTAVFKKCFAD